ncbi:MAG: bi-domain-containing oxidoreductase [Rhodospirillales bacterium]|jgi:predicted dehydrogenase/threonine dehydrogenase-like Zn-dependent dehydrogenase|nr:bi-domain-containing oxidoreductase [Rhodospirillales bacterium]MDP7214495.1 bi-domain-containing oxidoreductase [Rhodospirillales bacterium]HIJ93510.1 Gfo/Idh/MocA family oxidoreductase [Rhodospirillaceae bacterium]HJP53630.1 bi-domain-containing oxidoreductase [Rhodospirillales bacterium]
MRQVIQSHRTGKLKLLDVPAPKVRAGHLLVQTRASLISAGTERMAVEFASKTIAGKAKARPDLVKKVLAKAKRDGIGATLRAVLARLDEPLPLGYSAAGKVVALGQGLEGAFSVGQRVAVAGAGLANHAELNVVPGSLAAAVADSVGDEEACFATMGAIAMHSIRNLDAGLGDLVAVIGVGLLGQLACQLLSLAGARPVALDYNPERLGLARRLGAEAAFNLADGGHRKAVSALTGGRGCDGVLISAATASSEPFEVAAAIARDRARICMVGLTGTAFPFQEFMKKELSLVVSRSYGPGRYDDDFEGRGVKYPPGWVRWTESENLAECLRLMSLDPPRHLDVRSLTTHRFPLSEAETAYRLVGGGGEPSLGVVLTYDDSPPASQRPSFPAAEPQGQCSLGVIGAGNFARSVLLPELRKLKGVHLHTLSTRRGASAEQAGRAFGFARAEADETAVLENPAINAVLIATRHDSHAGLTARALEAGKSVLVEKPLGLSREEVNRVIAARQGSAGFFQVGFNRRHAPMAVKMRHRLAATPGPKFLLLRINAGAVAKDSWVHAPGEGGGRILGEVCHFVDLARFFAGSTIASVQAQAANAGAGNLEDVIIALRFEDGGLATVAYTARGDEALGKELFEAYAGGSAVAIDNFRTLTIASGDGGKSETRAAQDKGFKASLKAFTDAVANGGPPPVDETELVETSVATLAVMESLRSGTRIDL